jgi:hypothetical protein
MPQACSFEHGVDTIDINMGCPVNRIAGAGSGAGMMCNIDGTLKLVQSVVEAVLYSDQCEDAPWLGQQQPFRSVLCASV